MAEIRLRIWGSPTWAKAKLGIWGIFNLSRLKALGKGSPASKEVKLRSGGLQLGQEQGKKERFPPCLGSEVGIKTLPRVRYEGLHPA